MSIPKCIAIACLLLPACKRGGPEAKLADGDVVSFINANRGHELVVKKGELTARIRLIGIYAFDARVREKNEVTAFADAAITHWANTYQNKQLRVRLGPKETDPRGRFIGYLYDGDVDIGRSLISLGHAALYTEYPFDESSDYAQAEAQARIAGRGIWASQQGLALKRLRALRDTWLSLQRRRFGGSPNDTWLQEAH